MAMAAAIGATLALIVIATPIDRAGGSILQNVIDQFFNKPPSTLELLELEGGLEDETPVQPETKTVKPRFIVRFEEEVPARAAMRSFRENRTLGRQQFDEWVAADERFAGFRLEGLTLAGEAVISYDGIGSEKPSSALLKQLTRQLTDAPDVIYADPFQFVSMAR